MRAELRGDDDFILGFVGPRASGKTLHVITAIDGLHDRRVASQRLSLLGLDDTETRFEAMAHDLLVPEVGKPAETPTSRQVAAGAPAHNFCWELVLGENGSSPAGLLAIHDTAGESWNLRPTDQDEAFSRYVRRLSSVVFLIDGAGVAADLGLDSRDAWSPEGHQGDHGAADRQWLTRLVASLGKRASRVDVAVALAKSDLLWDHPRLEGLRNGNDAAERSRAVERALEASRRGGLLSSFGAHFRDAAPFAVSSLGFRPKAGDVDAEGHLKRKPEPLGVIDPMVWLLGRRLRGLD